MIPLNITMENRSGVTVLSNLFIDNFMKNANDAQIKVYLYLLRMVGDNLPTDISEIADKFNHTEKDVIRSLEYWEKTGLLSIKYGKDGLVNGIVLKEMKEESQTIEEYEQKGNIEVSREVIEEIPDTKEHEATIETATDKIMDYRKEKDNYSIEEIMKIKSQPEVGMILNITSQYIGRPLSPQEMRTVLFIYDRLNFSLELEDHLVEICVNGGNSSLHYIEQVAIDWYENGIDTVEKAKVYVKKGNKDAYVIMGYLGKDGKITDAELKYINRWKYEYAMPMNLIKEACDRTVLRTQSNRFSYADKILENWHKDGVKSLDEVKALDKKREEAVKSVMPAKKASGFTSSTGNGCVFEQHDYDFEALERAKLNKSRNK